LSQGLARTDVSPRQRLLDIFVPLPSVRGCPFLNASAEVADAAHPARAEAARCKQAFVDDIIRTAVEAGADDPDLLGHQLAVLSDGARAQAAALLSQEPVAYAKTIAEQLINSALEPGA